MNDDSSAELTEPSHNKQALTVFLDGHRSELITLARAAKHSDIREAILMAMHEKQNLIRTKLDRKEVQSKRFRNNRLDPVL